MNTGLLNSPTDGEVWEQMPFSTRNVTANPASVQFSSYETNSNYIANLNGEDLQYFSENKGCGCGGAPIVPPLTRPAQNLQQSVNAYYNNTYLPVISGNPLIRQK